MRCYPFLILSIAAGCSTQYLEAPEATEAPRRIGDLGYADIGELADGVRLTGDQPFRAVRLVSAGAAGAVFSFRTSPDGAWQELPWAEDLDGHRTTELSLPGLSDAIELRADGDVSFVQFELFEEGVVYDDDPTPRGATAARAYPGMWVLSDYAWNLGQTMYLPYEPAESCTGSLQPGTRALGEYLVNHFGATSFGGYNCRTIGGSTSLSVHSTGRAIDVYVPTDGYGADSADNDLGDPIGEFLVTHSEAIGVSYVIWDQASWGAHRGGDKQRTYGGVHPHNNHLHVELTTEGATMATPWFAAGGPDTPPDAEEPVPDAEDVPSGYLVGDWNGDGIDDLAVREGGLVLMDTSGGGSPELETWFGEGDTEDAYLVGDWNGDGVDNLAVRRGGLVLMDTNGGGNHDREVWYGDGSNEDAYLVGDWNGDGVDDLAVRRGGQVLMDTNGGGGHEREVWFGDGSNEDAYLVGDWNGDGVDNLAVRRGGHVLMDTNDGGGHELEVWFGDGSNEDEYLVGDWNGDGIDNIAVRRGDTVLMDTNGGGGHELSVTFGG